MGIFALVVAAELIGLWLVHLALVVDIDSALGGMAFVVAGALAVAFLTRAERR